MRHLTGSLLLSLVLATAGCDAGTPATPKKDGDTASAATPADTATQPAAEDKPILPGSVILQTNARIPSDCPLRTLWALPIPGVTIKRIWMMPRELDYDMILVQGSERDLIAIEASTGRTLWWKKLDGEVTGDLAISRFSIYMVIRNHLVNLEKDGGLTMWRVLLDFPASGWMDVAEEKQGSAVFFMASINRMIYGIDMIKVTWPPAHGAGSLTREDFRMDSFRQRTIWRFPTESLIHGKMDARENFVYATDLNGVVYAINTGLIHLGKAAAAWREYSQGANFAGVLTSGTFVIIGSRDRNVYCYARSTGGLVWRHEAGHRIQQSPAFHVDRWTNTTYVGVTCDEGPFLALDDVEGETVWDHAAGGMVVGLDEEPDKPMDERAGLIIHETGGAATCVMFKDGKPLWSLPAGMFRLVADNHAGPGIFAVLEDSGALVHLGRKP